jgi:hypothetical protein
MNISRNAIWQDTGFMVKHGGPNVLEFTNLNPEVYFTERMTRGDMLMLAWWLVRAALKR